MSYSTPEMRADILRMQRLNSRPKPETVQSEAMRYLRVHSFLVELRKKYLERRITPQQYSTLRGQATHGDLDGANKGLANVLIESAVRRTNT